MPDAPDWFKYRPQSDKPPLGDLGELAVRLGSPVSYNRDGSVVWFTDMSTGITPFIVAGDGDDWAVRVAPGYAMYGGFVMQMVAGKTGDANAYVYRTFGPQVLNKWGIEVGVYFPATFKEFHIIIGWYDGEVAHRGKIVLDDVNQKIYYRDVDNDDVELGSLPEMTSLYGQIQNMKLVIDVEDFEYVRFLLNTTEYNMSGITLWTDDAGDNPQSRCAIEFLGNLGDNDQALVDYVIYTIDEP